MGFLMVSHERLGFFRGYHDFFGDLTTAATVIAGWFSSRRHLWRSKPLWSTNHFQLAISTPSPQLQSDELYNFCDHEFFWDCLNQNLWIEKYIIDHIWPYLTPPSSFMDHNPIWVNCNISPTWIVRPFGDDFPNKNHDSRARSRREVKMKYTQ